MTLTTRTPSKYINRELSWLEFNQRVLDEGRDEQVPTLERLKFLAITSSNLDEFFMVRVGGLQLLAQKGSTRRDPSGMTPEEQLQALSRRAHEMVEMQYRCFLEEIEPALAQAGVRRLGPGQLTDRQLKDLEKIFDNQTASVLTPMAVSLQQRFPLLINQTISICVRLSFVADEKQPWRMAIIPLGRTAQRFMTLPSEGGYSYVLLEDAVGMFIERFFPGEQVLECVPFRITRNADLHLREDMAADLLAEMEEVLDARKQGPCVRLEVAASASPETLSFLQQALRIRRQEDIFSVAGPLDLSGFMPLTELQGFDHLKYPPWSPQPSPAVDLSASIFETLKRRDVMLYHPYESFDPVVRLVEEAADDPDVLAIKQILYRTSRNSPIVAALRRAAERGKYVTAIVELKARFDEARNIEWARNLEQAAVQVIYGVKGLKTHAKVCIIVRREAYGIQRYIHFGTGNYNESTARLYSDVSFMTANEELGADAISFFNAVTGYTHPQKFRKIGVAPIGLREKLLEMIDTETQRKKQGQQASISAKMNSLVDPHIIDALYAASQAGVAIKLNVRGICCLRPGVANLSENITVISIVDRFLEHARIFHFHHGGDDRVFIASADWMPRNLDRRVELLVPVEDGANRRRLIGILQTYFRDTIKSRKLLPDGSYKRVKPTNKRKPFRSQQALYRLAVRAVKQAELSRRTVFEPHRAPEDKT